MIVAGLTEITVIEVYDRGIPNKERILISINEKVNMGQYGLMLGVSSISKFAIPIRDNLLWFGDVELQEGDFVYVYTGSGEARVNEFPDGKNLYTVHWGKPQTILARSEIVPILFRVDAVDVADLPSNVPQLISS